MLDLWELLSNNIGISRASISSRYQRWRPYGVTQTVLDVLSNRELMEKLNEPANSMGYRGSLPARQLDTDDFIVYAKKILLGENT